MKNTKKNYLLALSTLVLTFIALQPLPAKAVEGLIQITKSLNPEFINANEFSTLSYAFSNSTPEVARFTAPFVETLPPGMIILGSAQNTCGGKLSLGKSKILLVNAKIPANGICQVIMGVTSTKAGLFEVRTPVSGLRTDKGANVNTSTVLLNASKALVADLRISKSLNPPTVKPDVFTTLTITLNNPNNAVARLSSPYTGSLPAGLVILGAASTTCGGSLVAKSGTDTVVLKQARIPAYGSCAILVGVTLSPQDLGGVKAKASVAALTNNAEQTDSNIILE